MTVLLQSGLDIHAGDHAPLQLPGFWKRAFRVMRSGQSNGKVILNWEELLLTRGVK